MFPSESDASPENPGNPPTTIGQTFESGVDIRVCVPSSQNHAGIVDGFGCSSEHLILKLVWPLKSTRFIHPNLCERPIGALVFRVIPFATPTTSPSGSLPMVGTLTVGCFNGEELVRVFLACVLGTHYLANESPGSRIRINSASRKKKTRGNNMASCAPMRRRKLTSGKER